MLPHPVFNYVTLYSFAKLSLFYGESLIWCNGLLSHELVTLLMQLGHLKDRLKQKNIYLHYTPAAVELLGNLGFDPNFGARPVKRVIQQMVENEIALGVLKGDFDEDDSIVVDVDADQSLKDHPPQKKLVIRKLENLPLPDVLAAND